MQQVETGVPSSDGIPILIGSWAVGHQLLLLAMTYRLWEPWVREQTLVSEARLRVSSTGCLTQKVNTILPDGYCRLQLAV